MDFSIVVRSGWSGVLAGPDEKETVLAGARARCAAGELFAKATARSNDGPFARPPHRLW